MMIDKKFKDQKPDEEAEICTRFSDGKNVYEMTTKIIQITSQNDEETISLKKGAKPISSISVNSKSKEKDNCIIDSSKHYNLGDSWDYIEEVDEIKETEDKIIEDSKINLEDKSILKTCISSSNTNISQDCYLNKDKTSHKKRIIIPSLDPDWTLKNLQDKVKMFDILPNTNTLQRRTNIKNIDKDGNNLNSNIKRASSSLLHKSELESLQLNKYEVIENHKPTNGVKIELLQDSQDNNCSINKEELRDSVSNNDISSIIHEIPENFKTNTLNRNKNTFSFKKVVQDDQPEFIVKSSEETTKRKINYADTFKNDEYLKILYELKYESYMSYTNKIGNLKMNI